MCLCVCVRARVSLSVSLHFLFPPLYEYTRVGRGVDKGELCYGEVVASLDRESARE